MQSPADFICEICDEPSLTPVCDLCQEQLAQDEAPFVEYEYDDEA
jgi:hypothetical protein